MINPQCQGSPCEEAEPRVVPMRGAHLCEEIPDAYLDSFRGKPNAIFERLIQRLGSVHPNSFITS